ncbi:response regulator [Geomonas sp. Red32]|uniref:hybrid sensor histidine kinase/response regulator n=1 Tax=Geomonas sp. Red32 TaxID=2912856 RepID=UPI00202CF351|nr:response regulator [Geomonas sp. Red32]MCM0084188.1 response regulator [Geomonas sp. Red32]
MHSGHMTGNYMEHGYCLNWEPGLLALHVGSDIVTGIAYYSIPLAMFYFAYRRRDLPFYGIFLMFAAFILSCGTTHLMGAYTIYRPDYWIEGVLKALTAGISAVTAIAFIPRIPQAISFPSILATMEEVKALNEELSATNAKLQMATFSLERVFTPVYWFASDGRILHANQAASEFLGYPLEKVLQMTVTDLNPDLSLESWPHFWDELKANGSLRREGKHLTSDGRLIDVEISGNYICYEGEEHYCSIVRDITDRKRAEAEQLANVQLEKQLMQAQKLESLGILAGGIAHDFNNILMAIIGNADLALRKVPKESPVCDNLAEINRSAGRAADLARQMLAYSGKGKFVVESIDLNRLVDEMLHMLKVSISKMAVLRFNPGAGLPTMEADATQIRQVIMNLIINASEAIGERSGVVAINTGWMECDRDYLVNNWMDEGIAEGSYVFLEICDTGCGMDEATKAKVFDPFFTTKFTGRGLGMAAVQGIVRGHKGSIRVYSELGKGTTFKLLFPASGKPAELLTEGPEEDGWRGSGTVLLVDDEETVRATGGKMLRELGFEVATACDGREALERFRLAGNVTLVVLDLTMPHMDGERCFRELKALDPGVKVIMSSGYNEQDVTQKFVGKGLAGFIQKPYKLSDLKKVIRETV